MNVVAVFLADDGQYLEQALSAIRCQTKPVSAIFVIDLTNKKRSQEILTAFSPDRVFRFPAGFNRPKALNIACSESLDADFYWFLNTRTVAAPTALESLLGTFEVSPGTAIAAPKVLGDNGMFFDYGQSITKTGRAVPLVTDELDQGQHDDKVDVMGCAYSGMLVRSDCFRSINGFDPGFSEHEQGLDFCIRTRLKGERVSLSPKAFVTHVGTGLRSYRLKEGYVKKRTGQLRRQIIYSPFIKAMLLWLLLIPRGVFWFLISLPTRRSAIKELWSHTKLAFLPASLIRSRRITGRRNSLKALSTLMVKHRRESRSHDSLDFFFRNGFVPVLVFTLINLALFLPFLAHTALRGGDLLPLNPSLYQVWRNAAVSVFLNAVYPADPFNIIPAALGTLTFWDTNLSTLILYLIALPLSCFAAWICMARIASNPRTIGFAACLYSLSPSLWISLYVGNLQGVIVHLILPFLCLSVLSSRTLRGFALASLLFALVTVASPSAVFPLVVLLSVIAIATSTFRAFLIVLPVFAIFIPLLLVQPLRLNLLADPIISNANLFEILFGAGPLDGFFTPERLVPFLLFLPILFLVFVSLWKTGASLLFFAVASAGIINSVIWIDVWQGPSLSIAWLGITGAAALGFSSMQHRFLRKRPVREDNNSTTGRIHSSPHAQGQYAMHNVLTMHDTRAAAPCSELGAQFTSPTHSASTTPHAQHYTNYPVIHTDNRAPITQDQYAMHNSTHPGVQYSPWGTHTPQHITNTSHIADAPYLIGASPGNTSHNNTSHGIHTQPDGNLHLANTEPNIPSTNNPIQNNPRQPHSSDATTRTSQRVYFAKGAFVAALATALGAVLVYIPYIANVWQGKSPVVSVTSAVNLPAYTLAEAQSNPEVGTLIIDPTSEKGVTVGIARGSVFGTASRNTKLAAQPHPELADLAVNLVMSGNADVAKAMKNLNLEMVLLSQDKYNFAANIDGNRALEPAGDTPFGKLWRLKGDLPKETQAAFPLYFLMSPGVFLVLLLFSIFGKSSRPVREEKDIDLDVILEDDHGYISPNRAHDKYV